jgi:membrane-bound lytic murein transglycosylase A
MRGRPGATILVLAGALGMSSASATQRPGPQGSTLRPVAFEALKGWAADDHVAAFASFRRTCESILAGRPELRPGLPPSDALLAACRDAVADGPTDRVSARGWFERRFTPWRVEPAEGNPFLTGYYEPEVDGSLTRSDEFPAPVLARPSDLVSFPDGAPPPLPAALTAARSTGGALEPYPDRAAIEDGALAGRGLELVHLRDGVEVFLTQVQGSARVRLPDGQVRRLVYAGRNGHPYTSIGRVIIQEGHASPEEMHLEGLKAWLRARPAEARRIMRLNRSYIFFSLRSDLDPDDGPIGAASVPLTPFRSLAVDRTVWPYGTPVWIALDLPSPEGTPHPFARLLVAQDTGSAIVGAARGDLFFGSGPAAGLRAGMVRHRPDFVVLLPRGSLP